MSAVPIKLFDWLKLLNSSKWSLIDSTKGNVLPPIYLSYKDPKRYTSSIVGKGLTLDQLEEAETELKELEETVLQ